MPAPLVVMRAAKMARRAAPLAIQAKRWWDNLSPQEKERYRRQARAYGDRGRRMVEQAYRRRGGR